MDTAEPDDLAGLAEAARGNILDVLRFVIRLLPLRWQGPVRQIVDAMTPPLAPPPVLQRDPAAAAALFGGKADEDDGSSVGSSDGTSSGGASDESDTPEGEPDVQDAEGADAVPIRESGPDGSVEPAELAQLTQGFVEGCFPAVNAASSSGGVSPPVDVPRLAVLVDVRPRKMSGTSQTIRRCCVARCCCAYPHAAGWFSGFSGPFGVKFGLLLVDAHAPRVAGRVVARARVRHAHVGVRERERVVRGGLLRALAAHHAPAGAQHLPAHPARLGLVLGLQRAVRRQIRAAAPSRARGASCGARARTARACSACTRRTRTCSSRSS